MARLIDLIVYECKLQGIETLTPQELDAMKDRWCVDSILQDRRECYITGATEGLHKHHVYAGSRRKAAEHGAAAWLR